LTLACNRSGTPRISRIRIANRSAPYGVKRSKANALRSIRGIAKGSNKKKARNGPCLWVGVRLLTKWPRAMREGMVRIRVRVWGKKKVMGRPKRGMDKRPKKLKEKMSSKDNIPH
jgi:hypothetical protein